MNNTPDPSFLQFDQLIDSHLNLLTHLLHQSQQSQLPTPQHKTFLLSLQTHYQTHVNHPLLSLRTLTSHQRVLLDLIPTTPIPPPPFLPLNDDTIDAVAYTPPLTIAIGTLHLSPQSLSATPSPRRYANAPLGHHTASQENRTSPLPKRFKFCAIRFGRTNNIIICRSWSECATHVLGYPNAQYKSFIPRTLNHAPLNSPRENILHSTTPRCPRTRPYSISHVAQKRLQYCADGT
jgi:hypothetical protein